MRHIVFDNSIYLHVWVLGRHKSFFLKVFPPNVQSLLKKSQIHSLHTESNPCSENQSPSATVCHFPNELVQMTYLKRHGFNQSWANVEFMYDIFYFNNVVGNIVGLHPGKFRKHTVLGINFLIYLFTSNFLQKVLNFNLMFKLIFWTSSCCKT